jgi:hypothetical protein
VRPGTCGIRSAPFTGRHGFTLWGRGKQGQFGVVVQFAPGSLESRAKIGQTVPLPSLEILGRRRGGMDGLLNATVNELEPCTRLSLQEQGGDGAEIVRPVPHVVRA